MTEVAVVLVAFGAPDLVRGALVPLAGLPLVVVDNSSDARVRAEADGPEPTTSTPAPTSASAQE